MSDPYTVPQPSSLNTKLPQILKTSVTDLLKIKHPILLAGMNNVASAPLAAAVSNAGGLGSIGGVAMTPAMLRKEIARLKEQLEDKTAFGVDLLLPQVGGNARKTNTDYTNGTLPELVDIIIESQARLFISAVGVPPKWVVDKLHGAGIICMNMCGHPRHVDKAVEVGIDIVCCQGYEGGGHTGEIGTLGLIPMCIDRVKGKTSPLHGGPIHVIAAGGIFDGRGVAACLALGAEAVWVGTRFIASVEATTSKRHKEAVLKSGATDTIRTIIYSGRPMRVIKTDYVMGWENNRAEEIRTLTSKGVLPVKHDGITARKQGKPFSLAKVYPMLVGQACGGVTEIKPALEIVNEFVTEAATILNQKTKLLVSSKM
eukprot:TRINITY_DN243_c1_g1_i1.p1 TRINITY_DN243_c1_g1~~TRINITY_DN243_c1_g1_i1.p1  ORF type:complete len:384 (+),score=102.38 TRINITY_DN243_c1_g1_i1:41-1153(+)